MSRPSAEIAITARVCILYGDFSGRSDSRFSCFESPVVPREKRVLLSVQRLVGSASGPALIKPCSQLLGVTLRMWRPFRLDLAGLRPSTNCASVSATCLGDSGGSWRVPDKNRLPRWSVAASVAVGHRANCRSRSASSWFRRLSWTMLASRMFLGRGVGTIQCAGPCRLGLPANRASATG